MEHNTDRILWTVLILAIGVALYVGFRPAANGLLHQVIDKTQAVMSNVNSNPSDNSSSSSSSSSTNTAVGANLYTDTQNFDKLDSWNIGGFGAWDPTVRWTKTTDTYKGLAVMQTTQDWWGLSQYIPVKKGDVLTYSAYAKYTSGTGTSMIYWQLNSSTEGSYSTATTNLIGNTVTITDSWQRVSGTAVVTSDGYLRPRLERSSGKTNTLQIAGIKVEKGDKATPYTP